MTGSKLLLDTNIIIEVFDGNKEIADKINKLSRFYVPAIVLGELYTGINRVTNKAKHLKKLTDFLTLCVVRHLMTVSKTLQSIVYLCLAFIMYGCEGFKFIAIENKSKGNITVTTQPGIETPELTGDPKTYRSRFDTVLVLPPDSTLLIPTYFGPLYIFNQKVKQEELKFNYVKIISTSDTIVANNKVELFKMLNRKGNVGKLTIK